MFCSHCGNQVEEGARFCSHCGEVVGETQRGIPAPMSQTKKKSKVGCILAVFVGISLTIIAIYVLLLLNLITLPLAQTIAFLPEPLATTWDAVRDWQADQGVNLPRMFQSADILLEGDDQTADQDGQTATNLDIDHGGDGDQAAANDDQNAGEVDTSCGVTTDYCEGLPPGQIQDVQQTADGYFFGFTYKFPEGTRVEDAWAAGQRYEYLTLWSQFERLFCIYTTDDTCKPITEMVTCTGADTLCDTIVCDIQQEEPAELFCYNYRAIEFMEPQYEIKIRTSGPKTGGNCCIYKTTFDFEDAQIVDELNPPNGDCPDYVVVDSQAYLVQNLLILDVTLPEALQANPPQYAYINTSGTSCDTEFESYLDCEVDSKRSDHLLCKTTEFEINSFDGICSKHLALYQDNSKECVLAGSGVQDMFSANQPTAAAGGDGGGQCPAGEEYHDGWGCCTVGCWCDGGCYNDCPNCDP